MIKSKKSTNSNESILMREMKEGYLYEIVSDRYTGSIVMKPVAIDYVIQVYSPNCELSGFRPDSQTYHRVKPYNGTVTLKNENENVQH